MTLLIIIFNKNCRAGSVEYVIVCHRPYVGGWDDRSIPRRRIQYRRLGITLQRPDYREVRKLAALESKSSNVFFLFWESLDLVFPLFNQQNSHIPDSSELYGRVQIDGDRWAEFPKALPLSTMTVGLQHNSKCAGRMWCVENEPRTKDIKASYFTRNRLNNGLWSPRLTYFVGANNWKGFADNRLARVTQPITRVMNTDWCKQFVLITASFFISFYSFKHVISCFYSIFICRIFNREVHLHHIFLHNVTPRSLCFVDDHLSLVTIITHYFFCIPSKNTSGRQQPLLTIYLILYIDIFWSSVMFNNSSSYYWIYVP